MTSSKNWPRYGVSSRVAEKTERRAPYVAGKSMSLTTWKCVCGCRVQVMSEPNGITRVRCPQPPCQVIHDVQGAITHMWSEATENRWIPQDFARFIVGQGSR